MSFNLTPHANPSSGVPEHDHPLRLRPEDIESIRAGLLALATPVPTAITPDLAGAVGTNQAWARADHAHGFTSGSASALTRTIASGEGASSSHARADHIHATDAIGWGILPNEFSSTASGAGITADGTTDFACTNTFDNTRKYRVWLISQWFLSAAGSWVINLTDAGTVIDRFAFLDETAAERNQICVGLRYDPATSGSKTLDVRVDEIAGAATLTFEASNAAPNPHTRRMYVEDIGPR